jgi:hypothetical protein
VFSIVCVRVVAAGHKFGAPKGVAALYLRCAAPRVCLCA